MFTIPQFQYFKWNTTVTNIAAITTTYDPYFNYTSLLINAESTSTGSQNSTFIDSSTNNFSITANGSPTQTSLTPYAPNSWGVYFNGSTDSIFTSNLTASYPVSSGADFTLEGWVYPMNQNGLIFLYGASKAAFGTDTGITVSTTNATVVIGGTSSTINFPTSMVLNQWQHWSLVRSNGIIRAYLNGIPGSGVSASGAISPYLQRSDLSGPLGIYMGIGIANWTSYTPTYFNGYISNVRYVRNQALYTGIFNPPTSALTTNLVGTSGVNVVTSLTGTVSLLTCQSNRFIDNSSNSKTFTPTGSPRTVSFNPFSEYLYNSNSVYFGGNGNYIYATNADFNQGATGAWTLETFIYPTAVTAYFYTVGNGAAYGNCFSAFYDHTNKQFGYTQNNGNASIVTVLTPTNSYQPNAWYHYAVSKDTNNNIRLFINGTLAASAANITSAVGSATTAVINGLYDNLGLGRSGSTFYLSNTHWVKGTCLYTSNFTPPSSNINSVADTKLLVCQDPVVTIENSRTPKTLTTAGTPVATKFTPFMDMNLYYNNYAGYFNGSSSLIVTRSSDFLIPANTDFTIETWVNPTATPNATMGAMIAGLHEYGLNGDWVLNIGGGSGFGLPAGNTSNPVFFINGVTATTLSASAPVNLNSWNHIAVTRSGLGSNNLKIFVNGIQCGSISSNIALLYNGSNNLCIGADSANDESRYTGYISNMRMVSGQALYTGDFTPATAPLTITSVGTTGANVAASLTGNVVLLACNNSTFIDSSTSPKTITTAGTPLITRGGDSSINSYNYLNYGAYFNGSSYLTTPYTSAYHWNVNDFTLELWVYYTATPSQSHALIGNTNPTGGQVNWSLGADTSLSVYFYYWTGAARSTNAGTIRLGVWNHLALTKNSNGFKVFVNGVGTAYQSIIGTPNHTGVSNLTIGAFNAVNLLSGTYVSNVRIVRGQALYTGNFTPATAPLSSNSVGTTGANVAASLTGTVELLTLQTGTSATSAITDNSPSPKTITNTGGVAMQRLIQSPLLAPFVTLSAANPYTPLAYSPSTHGGSVYFDGSSYLTSTAPSLSGNYTLECWFYKTGAGSIGSTIFHANIGSAGGTHIWINTSNQLVIDNGVNAQTAFTTFTIANNQWYHLAIVRSGSTTTAYLNGAVAGSNSYSPTANDKINVGRYQTLATYAFVGYISDARLVNGSTVYTTTFTPPTAPLSAVAGTSLLLKANNGAVYDATNKNLITVTGTTSASTTVTKFGSKSLYFNGGVNDYLTVTETDQIILSSGTPFTIEGWFYPTMSNFSSRYFTIFSKRSGSNGATSSYEIYIRQTTGVISFYNGSTLFESSVAIDLNAWNHIACAYDGSNFRLYKNGVSILGPTAAPITNKAANLIIGNAWPGGSQQYQGYIDDFRITKGINRYAGLSSFTIPTSAFPTQ